LSDSTFTNYDPDNDLPEPGSGFFEQLHESLMERERAQLLAEMPDLQVVGDMLQASSPDELRQVATEVNQRLQRVKASVAPPATLPEQLQHTKSTQGSDAAFQQLLDARRAEAIETLKAQRAAAGGQS
jgi:hypothetical protein